MPPWWHCHGTSPVADGGYKPQDGGQPEIEPYGTFEADPPALLSEKEYDSGYEPQRRPSGNQPKVDDENRIFDKYDVRATTAEDTNTFWDKYDVPMPKMWDDGHPRTHLYRLVDEVDGKDIVQPPLIQAIKHKKEKRKKKRSS